MTTNPTPKSKKLVFEAEIPGRVHAKKNSRRLATVAGRPRSFPSKHYSQWARTALIVLKQARLRRSLTLTGPLHASYTFHFKNRSSEADVSNMIEGPQDCLQESLIIENDKQVISLEAVKVFDGTEKTIIRLFELETMDQRGV